MDESRYMSGTIEALTAFTAGDLVISVVGDGDGSGTYTDNQATPIVLEEITTTGTVVGQMVLPQTTDRRERRDGKRDFRRVRLVVGGLAAAFGERSVAGHHGLRRQRPDLQRRRRRGLRQRRAGAVDQRAGRAITPPVARVVADISYNGTVDTSTAIYNIDNTNNPRSVATVNGTTFYISGQGVKGDTTQGVFVAQDGASSATPIDTSTDTRTVEIINGAALCLARQHAGRGRDIEHRVVRHDAADLGDRRHGAERHRRHHHAGRRAGELGQSTTPSAQTIHLSPENYFFASPDVLYIADGGDPKEGGLGDGGLQKWVYNGRRWTLDYTLSDGLNLVADTATSGTTGLIGLTGTVVGGIVDLYATN